MKGEGYIYYRLQDLFDNLTKAEIDYIDKMFNRDEDSSKSHYVRLWQHVQKRSEYKVVRSEFKTIKSFDDDVNYLEDRILQILREIKADKVNAALTAIQGLEEVIIAKDKRAYELAWRRASKILNQDLDWQHLWIKMFILEIFLEEEINLKPDAQRQYVKSLRNYLRSFVGYSKDDDAVGVGLIDLVKSFKQESTSKNNRKETLNHALNGLSLPFSPKNQDFTLVLAIWTNLIAKLELLANDYDYLVNPHKDWEELRNQFHTHIFVNQPWISGQALLSAQIATSLRELGLYFGATNFSDIQSLAALDENVVSDLTVRLEVNRIILKCFNYLPNADGANDKREQIVNDISTLVGSHRTADTPAVRYFLKRIYVLFESSHDKPLKPSTFHKYKVKIRSDNKYPDAMPTICEHIIERLKSSIDGHK